MSKENTTLKDDLLALGIDITGAQTKAKETTKQMLIASVAVVVAMAVFLTALTIDDQIKYTSRLECVKHAADSNVCVQLFKR